MIGSAIVLFALIGLYVWAPRLNQGFAVRKAASGVVVDVVANATRMSGARSALLRM
jgi:hypothetical protein